MESGRSPVLVAFWKVDKVEGCVFQQFSSWKIATGESSNVYKQLFGLDRQNNLKFPLIQARYTYLIFSAERNFIKNNIYKEAQLMVDT